MLRPPPQSSGRKGTKVPDGLPQMQTAPGGMEQPVHVRFRMNEHETQLPLSRSDSIGKIKQNLEFLFQMPAPQQVMQYNGTVLNDFSTLTDIRYDPNQAIFISLNNNVPAMPMMHAPDRSKQEEKPQKPLPKANYDANISDIVGPVGGYGYMQQPNMESDVEKGAMYNPMMMRGPVPYGAQPIYNQPGPMGVPPGMMYLPMMQGGCVSLIHTTSILSTSPSRHKSQSDSVSRQPYMMGGGWVHTGGVVHSNNYPTNNGGYNNAGQQTEYTGQQPLQNNVNPNGTQSPTHDFSSLLGGMLNTNHRNSGVVQQPPSNAFSSGLNAPFDLNSHTSQPFNPTVVPLPNPSMMNPHSSMMNPNPSMNSNPSMMNAAPTMNTTSSMMNTTPPMMNGIPPMNSSYVSVSNIPEDPFIFNDGKSADSVRMISPQERGNHVQPQQNPTLSHQVVLPSSVQGETSQKMQLAQDGLSVIPVITLAPTQLQKKGANAGNTNNRGHKRNPSMNRSRGGINRSQSHWIPKNRDSFEDTPQDASTNHVAGSPDPIVTTGNMAIQPTKKIPDEARAVLTSSRNRGGGGNHKRNPSVGRWVPKGQNHTEYSHPVLHSPMLTTSWADFSSLTMPKVNLEIEESKKLPTQQRKALERKESLLALPVYNINTSDLNEARNHYLQSKGTTNTAPMTTETNRVQTTSPLGVNVQTPPLGVNAQTSPLGMNGQTTSPLGMNAPTSPLQEQLRMQQQRQSRLLDEPSIPKLAGPPSSVKSRRANGERQSLRPEFSQTVATLPKSPEVKNLSANSFRTLSKHQSIKSFVGVDITAPSAELEDLFSNFFAVPGYVPPISAFPPVSVEPTNDYQYDSDLSNSTNFSEAERPAPEEEIMGVSSRGTSFRHISLDGDGLTSAIAGRKAIFKVGTHDAKGEAKSTGGDDITAILHGPDLVQASIRDHRNGTYTISYEASTKGIYDLFIGIEGTQVVGSPFSVIVTAGAAFAPQCVAAGEGLVSFMSGGDTMVFVQSRDQYGNPRDMGGDIVTARLEGPHTIDCPILDAFNGTYSLTLNAPVVGIYQLSIFMNGEHISGSPFQPICMPGLTSPLKSTASGTGLSGGIVGSRCSFTVQAYDNNGNHKLKGGDAFRCQIIDPKALKSAINAVITDNNNGTYTFTYSPDQSGQFEISVTLDGSHIKGSPFRTNIVSINRRDQDQPARRLPPVPSTPKKMVPPSPIPIKHSTENILKMQAIVRRWLAKRKYLDIMRKYAHRSKVAFEILSTEKKYVENLSILKERQCFFDPLRESLVTSRPILSHDKIGIIFSNFHLIRSINEELCKKLADRIQNWGPHQRIGDIFVNVAPSLQFSYSHYVNSYDQALKTVSLSQEKDPGFKEFLDKKMRGEGSTRGPLNLGSLLIAPVQRLPRYELLLSEMVKNTPQDSADYEQITMALIKIKDVTEFVNNNKRRAENLQKILSIQSSLDGNIKSLFHLNRNLIDEGTFSVHPGNNGKKLPKAHVYLFNDMIMVAKLREKGAEKGGYKFHSMMTLDNAYVQTLPINEGAAFRLTRQTPKGSTEMTIVCHNAEVQKKWVKQIKNVIIDVNVNARGIAKKPSETDVLLVV
ncbi:hypothetical protein PROFUN_10812 [Planoprotostelium fungivorum]|uniref:RhoGEF domain-containing protein n=1 Tax=Planoprotostelium fungivorum TaxID=1890364 RepID=A0A2P6NCP5_9EUKA|nr:hypothetical protein PROFUN_10812 [Planoprotostelium fungivorum]